MLQVAEDSVATLPQQQVADDASALLPDRSLHPYTTCSGQLYQQRDVPLVGLSLAGKNPCSCGQSRWGLVGQFCAEERSLIILIKTGRGVVHSLHCLGSICAERREAAQY